MAPRGSGDTEMLPCAIQFDGSEGICVKPMKIDIDAVPEGKRSHPDFVGLLNDMTIGMSDPKKVLSVCTHEAGHLFFGLEMRMEIIGLDLPQIIYVEPNQFQGHGARIKVKVIENTVEQIAVMLAAGGVVSRELDNGLGPGDSEDRALFDTMCRGAGLTDPAKIESLWKAGQDTVKARLQDPAFREMMRECGRRVMQDLEKAVETA